MYYNGTTGTILYEIYSWIVVLFYGNESRLQVTVENGVIRNFTQFPYTSVYISCLLMGKQLYYSMYSSTLTLWITLGSV